VPIAFRDNVRRKYTPGRNENKSVGKKLISKSSVLDKLDPLTSALVFWWTLGMQTLHVRTGWISHNIIIIINYLLINEEITHTDKTLT